MSWLEEALGRAADQVNESQLGQAERSIAFEGLELLGQHTGPLERLGESALRDVADHLLSGRDERARELWLAALERTATLEDLLAASAASTAATVEATTAREASWAAFWVDAQELGLDVLRFAIPLLLAAL